MLRILYFAVRSTERETLGLLWRLLLGHLHWSSFRGILPCLYAGSPPLGAWLGCMVYLVTLAFVCFVRFRRGHWKSIRLGTPSSCLVLTLEKGNVMRFDPMFYPYPSRRMVSVANRGMVATSQSLAAQAGLDMLKLGGNAVDAAVATAAALTVVEPTSNGLGGDAFAIVAIEGKLYGLNSSGPAPRSLAAHDVLAKGHAEMPKYGWFPVTVPGAVAGWIALWRRFGTLPLKELLRPAISYAAEGYPVTPVLAEGWKAAYRVYSAQGSEAAEWFRVFAPQGRPPACGKSGVPRPRPHPAAHRGHGRRSVLPRRACGGYSPPCSGNRWLLAVRKIWLPFSPNG